MTWTAEQDAIWEHWRTNRPIPESRCDETAWNEGRFDPPKVDLVTPTNSVWIRFTQHAVPRSGRPFALGESGPHHRQGLVVFQIFYPRTAGEKKFAATVEACRTMFHRRLLSASPQIQFDDSYAPERIAATDAAAEWAQVNVTTPYQVIEN